MLESSLLLPDLEDGVPFHPIAEPKDAETSHQGLEFTDLGSTLITETEEFLRESAGIFASSPGFVTRAQAGLRAPRSRSTNITPRLGGMVWHWVGARISITSHSQCAIRWREIQNFHMNTRGWVDVAYNCGVCPHGYVFAGRGAGVRSAANGTNHGNQNFYAVCAFLGPGTKPPLAMIRGMWEATRRFRATAGAGARVHPHGYFTGSTCPGPDLRDETKRFHLKTIPTGGSTPAPAPAPEPEAPQEDIMASIQDLERVVSAAVTPVRDAIRNLHSRTNEATRLAQAACAGAVADIRREVGLPPDPESDKVHVQRIREGVENYDLVEVRQRLAKAADRAKGV